MHLRAAGPGDRDLVVRAVALAVAWRPGAVERSAEQVLAVPELARYAVGWPRAGERGVVAQVAEQVVGTAWWRCFEAHEPGYGFVAADVPEVSLAVLPGHRGRGTGTRLLRALQELATGDGLPGLSLSVEPDNPAAALYRRLGFTEVGTDAGGSTTLLWRPG